MRESGIIDDELKVRQKETLMELQALKVKSGSPRLDDLLYGGIPLGCNIMVHGPPFIGKEVLVDVFYRRWSEERGPGAMGHHG